jgi:hypothetical protein
MPTPDSIKAFNARALKNGWGCIVDPSLAFTRSKLAMVCKLWRDRAGPSHIPARADFDARALKPVLPNMTLLERVQGRYRLRLHGTALTRYAGDHTGHFIEEMIPGNLADGYVALYDLVLREARPLRVLWDYQVPEIAYLNGESFVAPLRAQDDRTTMVLSVTYTEAKAHVLAATG